MSAFEHILFIDTAMNGCGVAVCAAGHVQARVEPMSRGQAEVLMPMVDEVVKASGGYEPVQAIVTTIGPGAFTGLRIGLSCARSLGLSLSVPVFGITTLQALALKYAADGASGPFMVVVETKRSDFYVQRFAAGGAALGEPFALEASEAAALLAAGDRMIGDAAARLAEDAGLDSGLAVPGYDLIDAGFIAAYFAENGAVDRVFSANTDPVYLRGADVSAPKTALRRIEGGF